MSTWVYECKKCGNIQDEWFETVDERKLTVKCRAPKCKGRAAYDFGLTHRHTQVRSGNHWKVNGGYEGGGEGSVAFARPIDTVKDQLEHDRKHNVNHLVEWKRDPKYDTIMRPNFRSSHGRKKWLAAQNGAVDLDSY